MRCVLTAAVSLVQEVALAVGPLVGGPPCLWGGWEQWGETPNRYILDCTACRNTPQLIVVCCCVDDAADAEQPRHDAADNAGEPSTPHTMAVCGIRSVSCPDQLQSQMQGGAAGGGAGGLGGMATPNPQVMAQMMQVWGLIRVISSWRGEH